MNKILVRSVNIHNNYFLLSKYLMFGEIDFTKNLIQINN